LLTPHAPILPSRDEEHLVAPSGDRHPDDLLGPAVHLGRVDVGHAEVEPQAQGGDRGVAIHTVDLPRALADH